MIEQFVRVVADKAAAHQAASDCYSIAKSLVLDGRRVKFTVGEDCEPLSLKQRKFLHGPVLGQISEQARTIDGARFLPEVWKEHYRALFIADKWVMRRALVKDRKTGEWRAGRRSTPHRLRVSTEDLSVKQYSLFTDKVIADAAVEWGVEFHFDLDEREAARYHRPAREREAA